MMRDIKDIWERVYHKSIYDECFVLIISDLIIDYSFDCFRGSLSEKVQDQCTMNWWTLNLSSHAIIAIYNFITLLAWVKILYILFQKFNFNHEQEFALTFLAIILTLSISRYKLWFKHIYFFVTCYYHFITDRKEKSTTNLT